MKLPYFIQIWTKASPKCLEQRRESTRKPPNGNPVKHQREASVWKHCKNCMSGIGDHIRAFANLTLYVVFRALASHMRVKDTDH